MRGAGVLVTSTAGAAADVQSHKGLAVKSQVYLNHGKQSAGRYTTLLTPSLRTLPHPCHSIQIEKQPHTRGKFREHKFNNVCSSGWWLVFCNDSGEGCRGCWNSQFWLPCTTCPAKESVPYVMTKKERELARESVQAHQATMCVAAGLTYTA